jgi:hypothetical protein
MIITTLSHLRVSRYQSEREPSLVVRLTIRRAPHDQSFRWRSRSTRSLRLGPPSVQQWPESPIRSVYCREDAFIKRLKEEDAMSWKKIHERFTEAFPGRTRNLGTLDKAHHMSTSRIRCPIYDLHYTLFSNPRTS